MMRRMLALALMTPVGQLRVAGLVAAICGVGSGSARRTSLPDGEKNNKFVRQPTGRLTFKR